MGSGKPRRQPNQLDQETPRHAQSRNDLVGRIDKYLEGPASEYLDHTIACDLLTEALAALVEREDIADLVERSALTNGPLTRITALAKKWRKMNDAERSMFKLPSIGARAIQTKAEAVGRVGAMDHVLKQLGAIIPGLTFRRDCDHCRPRLRPSPNQSCDHCDLATNGNHERSCQDHPDH